MWNVVGVEQILNSLLIHCELMACDQEMWFLCVFVLLVLIFSDNLHVKVKL